VFNRDLRPDEASFSQDVSGGARRFYERDRLVVTCCDLSFTTELVVGCTIGMWG